MESLEAEEVVRIPLADSASRLASASLLFLATNLLWIAAVALDRTGPIGGLGAGAVAWAALALDVPGALLMAAAWLGLRRVRPSEGRRLRLVIAWGYALWAGLSAYWRFLLPGVMGLSVQGLFSGLLGADAGALAAARRDRAVVEEILALWSLAAAGFVLVHALVLADYRRASDEDWASGLPVYIWLAGGLASLVSTGLLAAAFLPVLRGGLPGPTLDAGLVGKLRVGPNLMLSGYAPSLALGRKARSLSDGTEAVK